MNSIDTELETLFNRFADGIASDADEQRLGELLRSSAQARQAYREFMSLHSGLHWDYVAAVSPQAPPQTAPQLSIASATPAIDSNRAWRVGWWAVSMVGAVAATIVAMVIIRSLTAPPVDKPATPLVVDTPKVDTIAALLVDEVGAEFAEGLAPDGVRFGPGEYELIKGIVHLRFAHWLVRVAKRCLTKVPAT